MSKNNSLKRNMLIVGALIALILILDQLIKVYIKSNFMPGEEKPLIGDWFVLEYTENPGMAFGTKFGTKAWHKLALSIFRIIAIAALCYYWLRQAKAKMKTEFLIALGLIIAGATGNLIDSMFYDFAFPYDPCFPYNIMEGSGIYTECDFWGEMETKPRGFLLGNVVDMFKFDLRWPNGSEVFPAIWNVADASISIGVVMVFVRQRAYFPKKKNQPTNSTDEQVTDAEQNNTPIQ